MRAAWVALVVVFATTTLSASASADEAYVRPVNGTAHVPAFVDDGYGVELTVIGRRTADVGGASTAGAIVPDEVCVLATRTLRRGHTTVTREQGGCVPGGRFRFDVLGWTAWLDGEATVDTREETVVDGSAGPTVRVTFGRAPVRFAVAWRGHAPTAVGYYVRPPWIGGGYRPVTLPGAGAWVWREAEVTGRIRFDGLGLRADVPVEHRGTLAWS